MSLERKLMHDDLKQILKLITFHLESGDDSASASTYMQEKKTLQKPYMYVGV